MRGQQNIKICDAVSMVVTAAVLKDPGTFIVCRYGSADKSLARPGRKQANVSVRMA